MILISLHMLQLCQPLAPRCCFTVSPILLAALDHANRDCATAKPALHRYNSISASKSSALPAEAAAEAKAMSN